MTPNLIGISGFKGSGKNFVGDYFVERGYTQMAFADSIKDVCSTIFGWDRTLMDGLTIESRIWRETEDAWWGERLNVKNFSPRKAMQLLGTDALRDVFGPSIWINIVEKRMAAHEKVVITDCRFINELSMICDHDGMTIKVTRHLPEWYSLYTRGISPPVHRSEWEWLSWTYDEIIDNSNSKNQTLTILDSKFG